MAQSAHVSVNCHIIVIQDNNQVVRVCSGIVDALKCQAAADARVTDDGDYLAVVVVLQLGSNRHTQCRRDGVGGMAGREGVIFALGCRFVPAAGSVLVCMV